jgi:PAS domain S-box-containing protein
MGIFSGSRTAFFASPKSAMLLEEMAGFSEEQIRFIAEALPQIVWTARPDGLVDFMNSRWFEYTGLTEEETYHGLKTAVHPDDYDRYMKTWERAIKTKETYEIEYRFRRASDGEYRWHLGRGVPLWNKDGVMVKWFGTCTDIQSQKKAEEQLRHLAEHLESIVLQRTAYLREEIRKREEIEVKNEEQLHLLESMINTLPMAAAAGDPSGRILYANEQFHALFSPNKQPRALIGQHYIDALSHAQSWLPSMDGTDWVQRFRTQMGVMQACREEITLKDGRTFSFECIPTVEKTQNRGYLLLVRDISLQKRMDKTKSEFMSLASHQLRTPLTALRWALGRLRRTMSGKFAPDEDRLLNQASMSAAAMAQTIRTMLAISRAEAGLQVAAPTSFVLREFLESLANDFRDMIAAKQFDFAVECPSELLLHTDAIILREIVENLLSNALKYTPAGGTIRLFAEKKGAEVCIEVRDSGYGIPLHQHHKIFTKFFRGENILQFDTQGTGLGLYLVSQLIEALNAKIGFFSKPGKGTTFTLALPA